MTIEQIVSELIRQKITLGELSDALIRHSLFHYGNVERTSVYCGVSKPTVLKRMREFGITTDDIKAYKLSQRKLL
jgi:transcriptional regulator of acetoin/glycerol metabolism